MRAIPGEGKNPLTSEEYVLEYFTVAFTSVAFYNVIELNILAFDTFKRYNGLYFWSVMIATWGIFFHNLGFIGKFLGFIPSGSDYVSVSIISIGWYGMVTGQAVALWSRLHLVVFDNNKIIRYILYMIIIDAVCFHIPTTILTFGSISGQPNRWTNPFNAFEKVQMTAFVLQECIISGTYLYFIADMSKTYRKPSSKRIIRDAIVINLLVIALDIALLVCEYSNTYVIEATCKGMVYSIKLKAEFLILNRLRAHVCGPATSVGQCVISSNDVRALSINVQRETHIEMSGAEKEWRRERMHFDETSGISSNVDGMDIAELRKTVDERHEHEERTSLHDVESIGELRPSTGATLHE